jgi:hypothetical protein
MPAFGTFTLMSLRYALSYLRLPHISLTFYSIIPLLLLATNGRCFKIGVPVHHVAQSEAPVGGEQADYSVEWGDGDPEPVHVYIVSMDSERKTFTFDEDLRRPTTQFSSLFPTIPPEDAGRCVSLRV